MSDQHPDRDSLTSYIEGVLSIDATQWVDQHLGGCAECRARLERERSFLHNLGALGGLRPPADFTAGVMSRVAQYPAYQPAPEVQWRRIGLWAASTAAMLFVVLGFVGWILVQNAPAEGVTAPDEVTTGVVWLKDRGFELAMSAWGMMQAAGRLLPILGTVFLGVFDLFRAQPVAVQLALLLITVGLNYWFTRLVLNYQRRQ